MSVNETKVTVQVIRDPETISLLEAAKVAVMTEAAQREVDTAGISVSAVLYRESARISKELVTKFVAAEKDVNLTAIRLQFESECQPAEEHMRKAEGMGGVIPRCWSNAKSQLIAFIELGGDFNMHGTVSSCKIWAGKERKRLKEEEGRQALASIAAEGEHVKDTGKGTDDKGSANIEKSETTQTDVKVEQVAEAVADLDERVLELIMSITASAQGVHPDKAIKMLKNVDQQFKNIASKAVASVVNG